MDIQNIKEFHKEAVKIAEKEGVQIPDLERRVRVSVSCDGGEICYYATIDSIDYPTIIGNSSIQSTALQQFKDSIKRHQEGA